MGLFDTYKQRQMRETELARFHRWFVKSSMGWAYVDRIGRPKAVTADERALWLAGAEAHVDTILASANVKAAWAVAGLFIAYFGGNMLFAWLGISGTPRSIGIAIGTVLIEAGLIGVDIFDYFRDWRALRDRIEQAVASRAPMPIDPALARIPVNPYHLAQFVVIAPFALLYFYSHFDKDVIGWFRIEIFYGLALIAWALYFAAKRHDRLAQERLTR
jgi:hypothetical protein